MAHSLTIEIDGTSVPRMFYGTAWKEERTRDLTELALSCGFRAIDTANQRKHYYEEEVGQGIKAFQNANFDSGARIFLQTKFTFQGGQDQRLPYDPKAAIETQVNQSFDSSLQHLNVNKLDSFVLHGPMYQRGLSEEDWSAWKAMERLAEQGLTKFLGVSNVNAQQLKLLLQEAGIKPQFVQNRCFAVQGWDREVREICAEHGIIYQGFSLLTANRPIFANPQLHQFARDHRCTPAQLIYSFAMHLGMIVLTGTTNEKHIREALQSFEFELNRETINWIETIAIPNS